MGCLSLKPDYEIRLPGEDLPDFCEAVNFERCQSETMIV